jgi:hypothetical protein
MSYKLCFCVLALAAAACAKEPTPYQTGELLQMESVRCGLADGGSNDAKESLCQEYLVQMDNVIYRIRPRNEKHPVLLPVGTRVQFRLERGTVRLRAEDFGGKERQYSVLSVTPRTDANTAEVTPNHPNHLQ